MTLDTLQSQILSSSSRMRRTLFAGMRAFWRALNVDLMEKLFLPKKIIFIALDKDSLSMVYATGFLGKLRISAHRQYAYEWKPQNNISRKYLYKNGQLPRPEILTSTLELFISEVNAEGAKNILCIPKAWTVYRLADFPDAVDENLSAVVAFELDRLVSLNPEKAYYDYQIVNRFQDRLNVAIVAASADLVDSYLNLLSNKGLIVERVVTSLSIMGPLLAHLYGGRAFILLEVGKESYEAAGIEGETVLFAHRVKFADTNVVGRLSALADELDSLRRDWKGVEGNPKIVLTGDADMVATFVKNIDLPANVLPQSEIRLDLPGEVQALDVLSAAGSLNMTSGRTEGINLLSQVKIEKTRAPHRVALMLLIAMGLIGALGLVAPLPIEMRKIHEIESQIDSRREEYRRIEPQKKELDDILYVIKTVNEFKNSAPPMILLIKDLTSRLPDLFWLSQLKISDKTLEIEMRYRGTPTDVLPLLEASPYFKNVRVLQTDDEDVSPSDEAAAIRISMDLENIPVSEETHQDDVE